MGNREVKSVRDEEWLIPAEDAPDCSNCDSEMYERDSAPAGSTPTSSTFEIIFECPDCGHRLRATRRRP